MLEKLSKKSNISELETKILARIKKNNLIFGNRIQLAEIKIITLLNDLKYNESYFKDCYSCGDKISILDLKEINGELYCDSCISDRFYSCENCGELIYNDDIQVLENSGYCQECYFEVKQDIYKNHKIKSNLILQLIKDLEILNKKVCYNDLKDIDFKIDGTIYNVEKYAYNSFRLGSFIDNFWIDIGNCETDLLKAIDYNLGDNRDKLTNIFVNNT